MDKAKYQEIARQIIKAEETQAPIAPLTETYPEITVDDAYAIQIEVIEEKKRKGARVVGKKIGLTGEKIRQQIGVDEPDFGILMDHIVLREDEPLRMSELLAPRIEFELAFLLAQDVIGPGVNVSTVLSATEGVIPSVEVVDSRMRDWKIKLQDTIADNASNARVVLGPYMRHPSELDLKHIGMVAYINGTVVDTAAGAAVMGHPAHAVAWLANRMTELGTPLRAGEIIMSGSFTPVYPIKAGDSVQVVFDGLGTVSTRVVE
jgi:2-keto-4-pentenoate hydratase